MVMKHFATYDTSMCLKILSILFVDIVLGARVDLPLNTTFEPFVSLKLTTVDFNLVQYLLQTDFQ